MAPHAFTMTRAGGMLAAVVLFGLAALHVYWAAGGRWGADVAIPNRDGRPLFMPGAAGTLLVATLLLVAGFVMLGRVELWGRSLPRWPFIVGTWALVVAFSARVVGDLRWCGIFKRMTGTPFAWWDTWVYVPLCALLALAALLAASSEL